MGGGAYITHGRGNYKRSPQAVSSEAGKLHLLVDASYCIHGAGNRQEWKGKWTENGRKYQQTETGRGKRKRGSLLTLAFCQTPNAEVSVSAQRPHIPTHHKHQLSRWKTKHWKSKAGQIQIICAFLWSVESESGPRCVWERAWALSAAGPARRALAIWNAWFD